MSICRPLFSSTFDISCWSCTFTNTSSLFIESRASSCFSLTELLTSYWKQPQGDQTRVYSPWGSYVKAPSCESRHWVAATSAHKVSTHVYITCLQSREWLLLFCCQRIWTNDLIIIIKINISFLSAQVIPVDINPLYPILINCQGDSARVFNSSGSHSSLRYNFTETGFHSVFQNRHIRVKSAQLPALLGCTDCLYRSVCL